MDSDLDPGGPKTYGSETLLSREIVQLLKKTRNFVIFFIALFSHLGFRIALQRRVRIFITKQRECYSSSVRYYCCCAELLREMCGRTTARESRAMAWRRQVGLLYSLTGQLLAGETRIYFFNLFYYTKD
jgi:hypothetical protein